jgi:hypothetical protein
VKANRDLIFPVTNSDSKAYASEAGRFHDLAWNGFQGNSSLKFPGIGVQLIDHLDFIPKA